ncbi:MAG: hypothetical protein Q9218_002988 [Villophora microphyllina]
MSAADDKATNDKTGRWTDAEKSALMVSIVASFGTAPNWNNVNLPTGRSRMACWHVYNKAMEAAKGVPMTGGSETATPKKRNTKKSPAEAKPKGTSKGKRGRGEDKDKVVESDVSEDQGPKVKKIKGEPTDDDEAKAVIEEI